MLNNKIIYAYYKVYGRDKNSITASKEVVWTDIGPEELEQESLGFIQLTPIISKNTSLNQTPPTETDKMGEGM